MQLKDIALKNLQRRKSKLLFMVFGIFFGITTIVALFVLTGAMEESVNTRIQQTGIKIAVVPESDSVSFSVGGIPVISGMSYNVKDLPSDTPDKINSMSGAEKIKVIAPKVMGMAVHESIKILLVGVDFDSELKMKPWWDMVGSRPTRKGEVLIGSRVAEKFRPSLGSSIQINGHSLTVTGILKETGAEEDGIVFTGIDTARDVLDKAGGYSFVEMTTARDDAAASEVSREIAQKMPGARVRVIKEASEARQELVERFSSFSLAVSLVMILIAVLIIITTMTASVNERTREIGIFRAIGFRKAHITRIILLEAGIISGISALAGYFGGMVVAKLAAPLFGSFKLIILWNPLLGVAVLAGAAAVGVLASLYPAAKAAKLDPADALRFM